NHLFVLQKKALRIIYGVSPRTHCKPLFVRANILSLPSMLWSPIVNCCTDPILTQETHPVVHGEGPHWDPETQALYFVDVVSQLVNKYDPSTKEVTHAKLDGSSTVTFVIPVNGTGATEFAVSSDHDILQIKWDHSNTTLNTRDNEKIKLITSVENDEAHVGNHWNDGTMGPEPVPGEVELNRGSFYRIDPNSTEAVLELTPVSNSNGLIWNKDYTQLYYIDSLKYQVDVFDFYLEKGEESVQPKRKQHYWTSRWDDNRQRRKLVDSCLFRGTVTQVTSMMFGGPNLDILYVTTSRLALSEEEVQEQPLAGSVFSVQCLGVKALAPANNVPIVEQVTQPVMHAEGPHWDVETQILFYVDIEGELVNRYDPATGQVTHAKLLGGGVSIVIPVNGTNARKLLATHGHEVLVLDWNYENVTFANTTRSENITVITSVETNNKKQQGNRWNDGKADAKGRLWAANRRKVFNLTENNVPGLPDGMTMDNNGNLWVACFFGGRVININPRTGELIRFVEIPAKRVTSLMFGGPNLDILYVTTSRYGLSKEQVKTQPLAGSVFAVSCLGVKAMAPAHNVIVKDDFSTYIFYY
ncbi:hypothetical protein C0J52_04891, partial [Blattella germanica]